MIFASCHPDRPHVAKGKCKVCYNHGYNRAEKSEARQLSKKRARVAWKKTPLGRARTMLAQAKVNAKLGGRDLDFNLDLVDIVIPSHCPVLGIPLDCAAERPSNNLPSLDRIDNNRGYLKGNVWVISWRANLLKKDASLAELKALVTALETRGSKEQVT